MGQEQQELDRIMTHLASIGIEGPMLKSSIAERLGLKLPFFNIDHTIFFEEEPVRYKLPFVLDNQFKSYRLEKYTAEYHAPIFIGYNGTEAIDVAKLDELMSHVHWGLFFKGGRVAGAGNSALAKEALSQLNTLSTSNSQHDIAIAQKLMCKFWPPEQLGSNASKYLNAEYIRKRDFDPSCHATTAFMILSGRMDDIYEIIRDTGADDIAGFDLYQTLERKLVSNPDDFLLEIEVFKRDSFTKIEIPVQKMEVPIQQEGRYYQIDQYTACTSMLPEIIIGNYNGINTAELNREMADIDWSKDYNLFKLHEDSEPSLFPNIEEVARKMGALKCDPDGVLVYDQLSLKYWPNATFFSDLIRDEAWASLENMTKYQMEFPVELVIPAAINLLSGRWVKESLLFGSQPDLGEWVTIKRDALGNKDAYPFNHLTAFTTEQLENLIDLIPIRPLELQMIATQLERGDLVAVTHKSGRPLLLESNPSQQTINVYTHDKRPIPVNIHFDPEWIPHSEQLTITPALDKNLDKKSPKKQAKMPPKGTSKRH